MADRKSMPYAPPSNVLGLIERFRERSLPNKIDPDFLADVGISEGNVHRTLQALRFLSLIDEDGQPTPHFESLQIATPEEFQIQLEGLVRKSYSEVFALVDPSKDQLEVINNHFRRYMPTSQRYRQVTLFLALCRAAGIQVLDAPRDRSTRKPVAGSKPKAPKAVAARVIRDNSDVPTSYESGNLRTQYLQALIETVRHMGSRGEVPPQDLLVRIEKLLDVSNDPGGEIAGEDAREST